MDVSNCLSDMPDYLSSFFDESLSSYNAFSCVSEERISVE